MKSSKSLILLQRCLLISLFSVDAIRSLPYETVASTKKGKKYPFLLSDGLIYTLNGFDYIKQMMTLNRLTALNK